MNYQLIHNQIIERAQQRVPAGYTERHHIIPKCIGGNNSEENIVRLTAREHFIVHKLLAEIYPKEEGLLYAVWSFCHWTPKGSKRTYRIGAREYNRLKENFGSVQSATVTKQWQCPEHKAKMSASANKRWAKPEERAKLAAKVKQHHKDFPRDAAYHARHGAKVKIANACPEYRAKMSAAIKGMKLIHNPITKQCKRAKEPQLSALLNSGWIIGRIPVDK